MKLRCLLSISSFIQCAYWLFSYCWFVRFYTVEMTNFCNFRTLASIAIVPLRRAFPHSGCAQIGARKKKNIDEPGDVGASAPPPLLRWFFFSLSLQFKRNQNAVKLFVMERLLCRPVKPLQYKHLQYKHQKGTFECLYYRGRDYEIRWNLVSLGPSELSVT